MKLKSVEIKNYKLCRDVKFDFTDTMTVFLGKNGSGKTTILEGIHLLKAHKSSRYEFYSENFDESEFDITVVSGTVDYLSQKYTYRVSLYFEKDSVEARAIHTRAELEIHKTGEILNYNDPEYIFDQNYEFRHKVAVPGSKGRSSKYAKMREIQDFFDNISYISSTDYLNSSSTSTMIDISKKTYRPRHSTNDTWLRDLYELSSITPEKFKAYLDVVSRIGSGLVDRIVFQPLEVPKTRIETYRGGHLTRIEEKRDLVVPLFHINGNILYDNQLSEGTFRALALIFKVINNNSNLLIIEEPEVSVHFNLLTDLVEIIQDESKKRQIVMSTHSDKIVSKLDLDSVSIVEISKLDGIEVRTIRDKLNKEGFASLQNYLNEGGSLGEFLIG